MINSSQIMIALPVIIVCIWAVLFFGAGVLVLQNVIIGKRAIIAAGAVVNKNV